MHRSRGFSLVELLVVIGIIGILAGLAMPAYRTYTARAKFSEVISAAEPFKIAVSECLLREGNPKACEKGGTNGLPANINANAGRYVASIKVDANATVIATAIAADPLHGQTYTLTPKVEDSGMITWAASCAPAKKSDTGSDDVFC